MLPSRWSHLARYGLIGSSLLAATNARAERCDEVADSTVAFVLGVQVAPGLRLVGGIEARKCFNDETEGLARLELGGGTPRLIVGARARPFEDPYDDSDAEYIGLEAGGVLDVRGKLGVHLAATYGLNVAYLALQAHVKLGEPVEQPTRWSLLGALAPWDLSNPTVVEGRPISQAGRIVRPSITSAPIALRSGEARAARAHFVESARVELSSVWTFLRLAAELATVGAPYALVVAALDAADDEVRHAELCARAAGGLALGALPAAFAQPRFAARSPHAFAILAAEAWREGCLNETAAAEEARIVADATTGDRRTMLATIARDESGHAELSWNVLAWLFSVAPDVTRATLAAIPAAHGSAPTSIDRALVRHGVPTEAMTAAARAHAERVAQARLAELAA